MTERSERGTVLLAVLMALVVLSAVTAAIVRVGRSGAVALRAEAALMQRDLALQSALAVLGAGLTPSVVTLPRDGRWIDLSIPGGAVRARVQATSGLLNANTAQQVLMERLFSNAGAGDGQARTLAETITDARRVAPFTSIADLADLFANAAPLWARVRDTMTVTGSEAAIDPETAPRLALLAIPGMTTLAADALIADRARPGWVLEGRNEIETLYRPFLSGQDHGLYEITLRFDDAPTETRATAIAGRDGRLYLIALDWPQDKDAAP